jgi:hypothetical protein
MPMQARRGSGGKARTHLQLGSKRRWVVSSGGFTLWKDAVPIVRVARWASGPAWTARKISHPPGYDPWTVQAVATGCIEV